MAEQDEGDLLLTYPELAARLGVSPDGARTRAKRAGWPIRLGNDGRARVRVRASELPEQPPEQEARPPERTPVTTVRQAEHTRMLRELLDRASREVEHARSAAERAEAEAVQLRVELARAEERLRSAEALGRAEGAGRETLLVELREQVAWLRKPLWRRMLGRV